MNNYVKGLATAAAMASLSIASIGIVPIHAKEQTEAAVKPSESKNTFQATNKKLRTMMDDYQARAKPYDLEGAINYAIFNNPSIQAAYRSVQSKQWAAISDKRLWWPTASGAGPYGDTTTIPTYPTLGQRYNSTEERYYTSSTSKSGKNILKKESKNSYTILDAFNPAVAARWTFFDMARGAQINGSTEAAKAEEIIFNMTVRDTVLNVQQSYFALYGVIQYIKKLESDYNSNAKQFRAAENRYTKQPTLVNQNDIQQAKSSLYNQLEQLAKAQGELIHNAANLAQAMGLPIGTLVQPSNSFQMHAVGSWKLDLMETIDHALLHREEIQSAMALAKSQNHLATSLNYSYIPKLSLYGYADFSNQNGIYGKEHTSKENKTWSWGPSANIGLMLSWNFDGTVSDAKARSHRYAAKQFEAKAIAAKDMVASQTAATYAEYTAAKMNLDTSKAALVNAKQAKETSKLLYQKGIIDATTYATTSHSVSQASENHTKAIYAYNNAIAKLYRYTSIWPTGSSEMLDRAVQILKEG